MIALFPRGFLVLIAAVLAVAGCERASQTGVPTGSKVTAKHEHIPPHGGTVVELGEEEFHLELVLDRTAGRLTAYFLDGHLENFVRIGALSIEIVAPGGESHPSMVLTAVANLATGEKVGDTSMFELVADWLKTSSRFDGTIKEIQIKGRTYRDVVVHFPGIVVKAGAR